MKPCIFLLPFLGLLSVSAAEKNLCPNPGFEDNMDSWRYGGAFGGDPGFVQRTNRDASSGNYSLHFHKNGPKGGAQIFCQTVPPPWNNAEKAQVILSFRHKGKGMMVHIRFRNPEDRKAMKNELGKELSVSFRIPETAQWSDFRKEFAMPQPYLKRTPILELQFQMWGQGDAFLDEVSLSVRTSGTKTPVAATQTPSRKEEWLIFHEAPSSSDLPPVEKPPFEYGWKNGVLTRNGKPHFYTGNSTFGGGQYVPETIWLARLLNYSMVTLDWGLSLTPRKIGKQLDISFPDPASSVSMFRELSRNGLIVEHDTGNAAYRYRPEKYFVREFPQLKEFLTSSSHFYSYDHNTEIGRKFHFNAWKNRYRYLKGLPIMATEIYNELGYTPSHERVLRGFREFARKKYGTLENACSVWKKSFRSWDEVMPPHLSPEILPGAGSHGFRRQMVEKYWQMNYDWLRFCQLDLIPGLVEMKKLFRTVADTPFLIDWRGHRGRDGDGYGAVDPDLLEPVIDINGLHTGAASFDFRGEAADERSVLNALTHNAMHFDFVASNNRKVIINPECIVGRTSTPGSSLDSMRRNSFKNFSCEWKFKLEKDLSGLEKGYFKPGFDDSGWDVMAVPGCWDETTRYRDRKGFGWYRTTFTVPGRLKADFEDGSRRFFLYGKGVAQKGTVWINGVKVGEPAGWAQIYQYDVSPYLKYGEENQITFLVDGSNYANGLRFYVFVLPGDRINQSRLLEKRDYASFLWTHMMHGASGVVIWHWDDPWRPFMAELNRELDRVSEIAMPASRNRTAKAAMLMPFLYFRGLPTPLAGYFQDYMTCYAAMMFHQIHTAVLTEKNILNVTPDRYPLLLYPYARIVQPETFRHFKSYVEKGGTAVVTLDSLQMDFRRYESSGLEAYLGLKVLGECAGTPEVLYGGKRFSTNRGDMCGKSGIRIQTDAKVLGRYTDNSPAIVEIQKGNGRVVFLAANLNLAGMHALVGDLLRRTGIRPDVEITDCGDQTEFPYLEAQIAGDRKRFLLYLHNWGGLRRNVTVRLPFEGTYHVRNVRFPEQKAAFVQGSFRASVPSMEPGVWLFEQKNSPKMPLKQVSSERIAVLKRLDALRKNPSKEDPSARKVLFIEEKGFMPARLAYPNLTLMFRSFGAETWGEDSSLLTLEKMKQYACIVLLETNSNAVARLRNVKSPFIRNLLEYVKTGGNLFVCASSMATAANTHQSIWWRLGPVFGFSAGEYLRDDEACGYGDPYQIRVSEIGAHPVTDQVKSVQMFVCREFRLQPKCTLQVLLSSHRKPVMLTGKYGKGNVLFATDLLWMQPTRAEVDDNARLLSNLADFLLNGSVRKRSDDKVFSCLLLTEQKLRQMESAEQ